MVASPRFREYAAVIIILLLSAYLRAGQPGIVEYKRDEANLSQLALDLASGQGFPLLGIGSSVGVPNAPMNVYFLAIPYFFSSSPLHATQFIGLLNVLAIGVTYVMVRQFYGIRPALIAIILLATNPWAINFSRKIWAQNMLPLFIVLVVYSGLAGYIQKRHWGQLSHLPILILAGQIHYAAFTIIPVTAYLLVTYRKNITKYTLFGGLIAVVLLMPFAIGMFQAGFNNPSAIQAVLVDDSEAQPFGFSTQAAIGMDSLISGWDIHALAGPQHFQEYLDRVPRVSSLFRILSIGLIFGVIWLIYHTIRQPDSRTPINHVLLIWLIIPITAFSISWTPFFIHYLIPAIIPGCMVIGIFADDMVKHLRPGKIVQFASTLLLLIIVFLQVWLWMSLLNFVDQRDTPGGFGTPLHYLLRVRDAVVADAPTSILVVSDGQALIFDEEPTIWNTLFNDADADVRFASYDTQVFPRQNTTVLTDHCMNEEDQQFLLRDGQRCYAISSSSQADLNLTQFEPTIDIRFDNGVNIIGYHWQDNCLSIAWEIVLTTIEDYMFAVHFVDGADKRIQAADGLSWFGEYWRPGDIVVREFCLNVDTTIVDGVYIGMYTYDGVNFHNINVIDENNMPIGQSVRWMLSSES